MGDEDEDVENPKGKCDDKPCEQSAYVSQLTALISESKGLKHSGASRDETRLERVRLGKEIQKVIKLKKQAAEKSARMAKILGEFSDLKELAKLSNSQRKKSIIEIKDKEGNAKQGKDDIADVFAAFYEELYMSKRIGEDTYPESTAAKSPPLFTISELDDAVKLLQTGKARDKNGIAAEMIKVDCPELRDMMLEVFNDILQPEASPPSEWRQTRLVVLLKKGDPALPSNYRPIAILPVRNKLFSRMLCARLQATIMQQQSVDQAAYRKGFCTQDHLLCTTLLIESALNGTCPSGWDWSTSRKPLTPSSIQLCGVPCVSLECLNLTSMC